MRGATKGKIGFHGGKVAVRRLRVRSCEGHEVQLPTWSAAQAEDWLGRADQGDPLDLRPAWPIQRCQIHKARNVIDRLPKPLASVRKALRQAWELEDADKAERLLRNLARRIEQEVPGAAAASSKDSTRC